VIFLLQSFVKRAIEAYDISSATIRPSVAMYGNSVNSLNALSKVTGGLFDGLLNAAEDPDNGTVVQKQRPDLQSKDDILQLIDSAPRVGGARRVGNALAYTCDVVLEMQQEFEPRPVPKVVIVISSGPSYDDIPRNLSCFTAKPFPTYYDVTILGVAVGTEGKQSLTASVISDLTSLESANKLQIVDNQIGRRICRAAIHDCPHAEQDLVFFIDG